MTEASLLHRSRESVSRLRSP